MTAAARSSVFANRCPQTPSVIVGEPCPGVEDMIARPNAAVVWPDPQQQILPKLDNQQIWTGPGLCLLVLVNSSNYPDFLRLLFAMARDVLLAGNATTVPADESLSCLSAAAVLSAEDFSLDSGANY
jgi:hypothetical protein